MCTNATSSSSAGIATSSSPSAQGGRNVLSWGFSFKTSEPRPARVGRNGSRFAAPYRPHWNPPSASSNRSRRAGRRAAPPPRDHAVGALERLDRAGLTRGAEVRLERDRVERDEPEAGLLDPA